MNQICLVISSLDPDTLRQANPAAFAENLLSMRIRFEGPFRNAEWAEGVQEDLDRVSQALAAGKSIGVLTNIRWLGKKYVQHGARSIRLPLETDFTVQLMQAALKRVPRAAVWRRREPRDPRPTDDGELHQPHTDRTHGEELK